MRAGTGVNAPQELRIKLRGPQFVEPLAEFRYHATYCLNEEMAGAHNLAIVRPNIEPSPYNIDVRRRAPLSPSVCSIRIAESHVYSRYFLVLQDVADHLMEGEIGPDSKFADAVAVTVPVSIFPEFLFEFLIRRTRVCQPIAFYREGQGRRLEIPELDRKSGVWGR